MKDLRYCLDKMQAAGRLAHIKTPVDAVHELSGISAKLEGGKALVLTTSRAMTSRLRRHVVEP